MNITQNYATFLQLREKFSFLRYRDFSLKLTGDVLSVNFSFDLSGQYFFQPSVEIPVSSFPRRPDPDSPVLRSLAFHLGMVELISDWKTACPPKVIVDPYCLNEEQTAFWKKIAFHGLGEFFYLNGIETSPDEFLTLEYTAEKIPEKGTVSALDAVMVPVGGGKDSAVTLEILKKSGKTIIPFAVNPRRAITDTVTAAGYDHMLSVKRSLDPLLLELNAKGFLNGHTPFSALLAFLSSLTAAAGGYRYIALSNESSANEPTVAGTKINHQYSKSYEFESDFRDYLNRWITPDIEYFSFLRPMSELQIARLFSRFGKHHPVFRSCNAGSKTDSWCGHCPKCLFTFIMLHAFMGPEKLLAIFGSNLLESATLQKHFDELTGVAAVKPFECVGTVDEVNLALQQAVTFYPENNRPFLLDQYVKSGKGKQGDGSAFRKELQSLNTEHFLNPEFLKMLKDELDSAIHS